MRNKVGEGIFGQYAIRINRQWRIAFTPTDEGLADVEITDYR